SPSTILPPLIVLSSLYHTKHVYSPLLHLLFYSLIPRPPRSTPFPTRRSSDLVAQHAHASGLRVHLHHCQVGAVGERPAVDVHQRSEEHTSELQSPDHLVCRLLLEKKKKKNNKQHYTYHIQTKRRQL